MRRIFPKISVIAVLAGSLLSCRTTANTGPRLDALFADLHARGLFDGAVVVSDHGRTLFAKGYGDADAERKVAFTPDTAADGASLAKTITAALLIQLQREGALSLDDPARKYLPELPYADVTLRHLLSHSSGIPVRDYDYFDRYLAPDEIRTTETLLRVLAEQKPPLATPPGTAFEYSSFCYDLAALAAARAAGKPYAESIAERFFGPLAIESAFVRPGRLRDFPAVRTLGYRRVDGRLERNEVFDFEAFHGGSNIYISARDLDRWNTSFFSSRVMTRAEIDEAQHRAAVGGNPSGLTLGSWYRSPDGTRFWYSGHLQGFHDEVFRDVRTMRSIVYMSNNTLAPWLQKAIVRAVTSVLDGGHPLLDAPQLASVGREQRESLAGEWKMDDGTKIVTAWSDGHLSAIRDGVRYRIVQLDATSFYIPGLDWILGFADRPGAPLSQIYLSTNIEERWGSR